MSFLLGSGEAEAIAFYNQQIQANPDVLSHYWHLGLAWLLQGEIGEAQAVWLSAVTAAEPEVVEAGIAELRQILTIAAEAQLQAGRFDRAEQIYGQILELDPMQAEILLGLGSAVSQQGRYDEAIAYWQSANDLQPVAEAYQRQAEVWQTLGQVAEAIAAYTHALQVQPDWQTHYRLGLCWAQQHQWQAAAAQFRQAIRLNPTNSSLDADLGWALLQLQEEGAIAYFQQALYTKSNFAQIYCNWVESQDQSNRVTAENAQFLQRLSGGTSAQLRQALVRLQTRPLTIASQPRELLEPFPPPSGFYQRTQDWATRDSNGYMPLNLPHQVRLTAPHRLDREIHFSFRFGAAIELPQPFVAQISQGRFWLSADQTSSAVITPENQLLGDLSPEFPLLSPSHPDQHPSRHSLFSNHLPPVQPIEGSVAVLAGLTNDLYFHWMLDVLPRWHLLQCSGVNLAEIDKFLVSDRLSFQRETLESLGIPSEKILSTQHYVHLQADRLIVPSYPGSPAWMPQWACDWLRQQFLPTRSSAASARLYINRSQAANRRLINEAEVLDLLQPLGFQSVVLELLSVRQQVALLSTAEAVVSLHGGGLTNLVFCPLGTRVIELFSPHYVYPCYWLVSNLVNLQYYYLQGTTPEGWHLHRLFYPDARIEDVLIDLNELQALLHLADIH